MTITDYFQIYSNLHVGEEHTSKQIKDEILLMSGDKFERSSIMPQDYAWEENSLRKTPLHETLFFVRLSRNRYLVTPKVKIKILDK